jgi:hypothetical protein
VKKFFRFFELLGVSFACFGEVSKAGVSLFNASKIELPTAEDFCGELNMVPVFSQIASVFFFDWTFLLFGEDCLGTRGELNFADKLLLWC